MLSQSKERTNLHFQVVFSALQWACSGTTFEMVNIASLLHVLGLVYASTHVLSVSALTTPELRSRSIYQIFTDRFARHDGLAPYCDTSQRSYCGGTWKGIEGRLDYIQGMGFDTGELCDSIGAGDRA